MTANDELLDAALRHAIYSERYGRGLAKKIVSLLDAADADLTEQLAVRLARIATNGSDTGPATTRRLQTVIDALKTINDKAYRKVAATLEGELVDLADFEIENQAATLAKVAPVEIVAPAPTPAFLQTLVTTTPIDGVLLKPWVDGMAAGRLARIEKALRIGMVESQTVDQLVRRIRGTRANGYRDGILEISRRSATTLALTANSTIANAARDTVYRQNARLISKLKWVSTLDSRTSSVCQSRDGKLYAVDEPHPTPPAHPRCRSIIIPVTVPFSALGVDAADYSPSQRASMDGKVPGNVTFGDWLKNQPRARVEEIYGKERADLFLSGKVGFADLYKQDGSFYSLADLRARSASAPKPAPPKPTVTKPPVRSLDAINADHDADMKAYTLDRGRADGKEHLAIYDAATGKAFPPVTDGKKGYVSFPPWMNDELRNEKNQIVLHHNHPGSSSFSPADLSILADFRGAKAIWAHGHNGSSYYAERGPRKMTDQSYALVRKWGTQWLQRQVNAQRIPAMDANLLLMHIVTRLAEKQGYVIYRADLQQTTLDTYNRHKTLIDAFLDKISDYKE